MSTACPATEKRSVARVVASGVLGGLIGLAAGLLWENRFLVASSAGAAMRGMGRVRDDHWLERHPIDYA